MSEWINVKNKSPQIPCLGLDAFNQVFILRELVCLEKSGEQKFYDGQYFDPAKNDFREIKMGEYKVKVTREIKYWMPFPEMPND